MNQPLGARLAALSELPARRTRQIEAIWIGAGAILAALFSTAVEVL